MIAPDTCTRLDRGAFTVSLDFELAWGTRGRPSASSVGPYLAGTRIAIDRMLELFDRYGISATWVMVGGLMLGGPKLHLGGPKLHLGGPQSHLGGPKPHLGGPERHRLLQDTRYDDIPRGNFETAPDWYADDIVAKIRDCHTPQEIGCHTLTHMYVNETETSRQQFDWELNEFVKLFDQLGLPAPLTFIFPKHYMHHFDLIAKHGFKCYRGPETGWFERLPTARLRGAMRLLNSRLRRTPVVGLPSRSPEGLVEVPSSHFYAPFQSVGKFVSLNDRVAQAIGGLNAAARMKKIYHLWTHPFNMGCRTEELMDGLEQILKHYQKLADAGEIEARAMRSYASCLESDR